MGQIFSGEKAAEKKSAGASSTANNTYPSRPVAPAATAAAPRTYSYCDHSSYSTGTTASAVRPSTTTQARPSSAAYSSSYSTASTVRPTTTTHHQARTTSSTTTTSVSARPVIANTSRAAFPGANTATHPNSTIRSTTSIATYAAPTSPKPATVSRNEIRRLADKKAAELLKHQRDCELKRAEAQQQKEDAAWRARLADAVSSAPAPTRPVAKAAIRASNCEDLIVDAFANLSLYESSRQRQPSGMAPSYSSGFWSESGTRLMDDDFVDDNFIEIDSDSDETGTPLYVLAATDRRVCVFEPGREKFIEVNRSSFPFSAVTEGDIYHASLISRDSVQGWSQLSALRRQQYTARATFAYGSEARYRELILPALLLGSRVRDYEQRCATVNSIGPLVLNMPAQNRRLKMLKLKTSSGESFEIDVKYVKKGDEDKEKRWTVTCHPPKPEQPLPLEVRNGALLEIQEINAQQPRVTFALLNKYSNPRASIDNWKLLSCIYGAPGNTDYPKVKRASPYIRLANNKGNVELNPEQVEAVSRYNCESCPAFVVESPPGSGKTMTAAAMAVRYEGDGVQLFLSTANVPVINMALALAKLDYGRLKACHLISSEREELMTEETRSPFSVLSLAKANEKLVAQIERLEEALKTAPNEEEKEKLKNAIRKTCGPVQDERYHIYFGTVDMMLGNLFKKGQRNKVNTIQKQLANEVRRVVVDEASQLTESALNALILCFPLAQIVLIGDSKQLPPFRYVRGDVVSEMAAKSALEVIKVKNNLPVIKLSHVYRASPTLMAHYSDVFYGGSLVSGKKESTKNLLACFGARSGGYRTLFWQTKGYQKQSGTSKFNDGEITTLKYLLNILRNSGHDEKEVMIISYYEAQRKKAEEELQKRGWEGYEVLTVDSAQGREKKIVIVMTTRTSVPTEKGAFFSCPLRCNVAVSRHQEALIVLGHSAIASAPNWSRVLSPKYFRHVTPYSG